MRILLGRRGIMCIAKRLDVCLTVPWTPLFLCGRYGIMCIAKGLDIYPGIPWALPFCVADVG